MKQKILVLGMIISCLLGLTACGETTVMNSVEGSRYSPDMFTNEQIRGIVELIEDDFFEDWYLQGITPENFEKNLYFTIAMNSEDDTEYEVLASGYDSWYKAIEDLGYNSKESLPDDILVQDVTYSIDKEGQLVVDGKIKGTKHSADMIVYLTNRGRLTDIGVTVERSSAEKLENAGLNTLLGMGMAFAILIIISLIISLFPILIGGNKKKKESDKEIAEKAIESAVTQIADKEEEDLSSDSELVAVIAAAIAAYEGTAPVEGFQVRSIRKVNSKWKANK